MKILVTGGAGFIGSAYVRKIINDTDFAIVNVDKLTYAASAEALASVDGNPRYAFERADISDAAAIRRILGDHRPDAIINFAAETHVDRSIDGPSDFIQTNIIGTFNLLEQALEYWRGLECEARETFRFHHVSTDEVYGSLGATGTFDTHSPYRPSSPYAASKAAADHLARAWFMTYDLPVIVTNSSNNYGPFQFPEKLIPVVINKVLAGKAIPVYGKGENVRDWIYVEDHVDGLLAVLDRGRPGESYNLASNTEKSNLDMVREVCRLLDERTPGSGAQPYESLITFVTDRPGHDFRYALNTTKVGDELGWTAGHDFEDGLRMTVDWYLDNVAWLDQIGAEVYGGERLGLCRAEFS